MATKNTDRAQTKLISELNKLMEQSPSEVCAEIHQEIKVISQEGYKLPDEEHYAEMAGRIRKEAEEKVANRRKYSPYGNMDAEELVRTWCSSPKLRIEFDSYYQRFVNCIIETFPDSPAQEFLSYTYLREFPNEDLDRMIRDIEQKQASGDKEKRKGILRRIPYWIYILTLFFAAVLGIFHYLGWLEPIKEFFAKIFWPK